MVRRQPPPRRQTHGPSTEPALMVMSINIEGLSSAKQQILADMCDNHKFDVLCMQETHRGPDAVRPRVSGMKLVAEIPHEKYGSALFVRNSCDSTSTSNIDNIEIIQAKLNGVTVTSYYKPPNEKFEFKGNTASTPIQVVIGDFNSHSTVWGYRTTNDDGTLVENWSDANRLVLIHDSKLPKSFNSARWKQGYNPDLSFVSSNIAHQCEKLVMDVIPKTQHRPIGIKIKAAVSPQEVPFRRRYNLKKADWEGYEKFIDRDITKIMPTPDNYGTFVDLVKEASRNNIPRGCHTSYICGLNDESKELYEIYKSQFEDDPFDTETTETGNKLANVIAEAQQQKWQDMIEATDFTHSCRKAWKTIDKLTIDYTKPPRQCEVTANQVAHQLLLNGKGNTTQRPKRVKIPSDNNTEHPLTSPFNIEELAKGIKVLKNNKAAGLDDMLCEQIKHLGPNALVWLLDMMNNILVSKKFPKLWRKSKVIAILKPGKDSSLPKSYRPISLLCHTYKLFERMILNRLNPLNENTIIKEQAGFRAGKSCTSQLLNLTQYIEDGYEQGLITSTVFVDLSAAYDTVNHRLLLTKLYRITDDAEFTNLIGKMLSNRRFYVELNGERSRWRNQKNGLPQGSVLSPMLFNIYTNDQPIHTNTRSFIYADDLCMATQHSTFERTETILSEALESMGKYYEKNQLRANPEKTQTCTFHLKNREAKRKLNITWYNKKLEHTPNPVYLGVTLDRTLSYKEHIQKLKCKTAARNNILRKLASTTWGANPRTIKTTALALCYSTAEYACPVWERSKHASKLDPALNEACRTITGCLRPTNVENVYLLAGIAPPATRRNITAQQERRKQVDDTRHSLHNHQPATKRLKSRNSFLHSVVPLDGKPSAERITSWTHHLQSVPQKLSPTPTEDLANGSEAPRSEWRCLNRLRTGMGRCRSNMKKWKYSDDDTMCECGESTQTMEHLLKCRLLEQECTPEDLMEYNDTAKDCVRLWMSRV